MFPLLAAIVYIASKSVRLVVFVIACLLFLAVVDHYNHAMQTLAIIFVCAFMAGINQTIMMSLAMVVIASLVSAPGLGVLVLRGIRNLELGVGLVSGLGIVLLAIILDRTMSKSRSETSTRSSAAIRWRR